MTGDIWLQCIVINKTITLAQHAESVVSARLCQAQVTRKATVSYMEVNGAGLQPMLRGLAYPSHKRCLSRKKGVGIKHSRNRLGLRFSDT